MKVSIVGTAGVPAAYGGFETLAENIVKFNHERLNSEYAITVYCSGPGEKIWRDARLVRLKLSANGVQSVFYDVVSMVLAVWRRSDVILVLGVSGAICLPVIRMFSRAKLVVNVDGIEWRREKWGRCAAAFLRLSERIAVRFAHAVIADNLAVKRYLEAEPGIHCELIAYGGDHALVSPMMPAASLVTIPTRYYFSVCRIEPENNIEMILRAFSADESLNIIFVGNWLASSFGIQAKEKYSKYKNILLLDPIYDLHVLSYFRTNATGYVHGHSAGGTNPALVEAMHFARPVYAFDCSFNRETTEHQAIYFKNSEELRHLLTRDRLDGEDSCGAAMKAVAQANFTWDRVAKEYFALFDAVCVDRRAESRPS